MPRWFPSHAPRCTSSGGTPMLLCQASSLPCGLASLLSPSSLQFQIKAPLRKTHTHMYIVSDNDKCYEEK